MFYREENSINIKLEPNEELICIVSSGPYMMTGTTEIKTLNQLIEVVKAKNAHVLILLGPFLDINHDQISTGNIPVGFEDLLQNVLDEISAQLGDTKTQVIIQPSLNDITQEQIYPVHPFTVSPQFIKNNQNFHFMPEPSMIKINDTIFAITTTDIIKDLTSMAVSKMHSSDKISRNFVHLLRQRSFYPIYPPPDNVCIDYEAWEKYAKINIHPKVFIAVSDLATFNKEVNNCTCINPGRLVRGTSTGTYGLITISQNKAIDESQPKTQSNSNINVTFNKF